VDAVAAPQSAGAARVDRRRARQAHTGTEQNEPNHAVSVALAPSDYAHSCDAATIPVVPSRCFAMENAQEEEDRRLTLETDAETTVAETTAALTTAQEAVASTKELAAKSAIPADVKRADVTPEMKQAAREGQKAVSEAEGKLSKLTTQLEECVAAKEAVQAQKGDPFSVRLAALIAGFSEDVAELAAINDAGALIHGLVWLKTGDGQAAEQTPPSSGDSSFQSLDDVCSCIHFPDPHVCENALTTRALLENRATASGGAAPARIVRQHLAGWRAQNRPAGSGRPGASGGRRGGGRDPACSR
jgi:hypothetical protein